MTHKLKILPKWYDDVLNERKKFEIRKNDRDFKVGDKLLLQEWERGKYTGREILKEIEYIYHGDGTYGLNEEYCILGLKPKILMQMNVTQTGGNSKFIGSVGTLTIK